jgi:hypothetical protein
LVENEEKLQSYYKQYQNHIGPYFAVSSDVSAKHFSHSNAENQHALTVYNRHCTMEIFIAFSVADEKQHDLFSDQDKERFFFLNSEKQDFKQLALFLNAFFAEEGHQVGMSYQEAITVLAQHRMYGMYAVARIAVPLFCLNDAFLSERDLENAYGRRVGKPRENQFLYLFKDTIITAQQILSLQAISYEELNETRREYFPNCKISGTNTRITRINTYFPIHEEIVNPNYNSCALTISAPSAHITHNLFPMVVHQQSNIKADLLKLCESAISNNEQELAHSFKKLCNEFVIHNTSEILKCQLLAIVLDAHLTLTSKEKFKKAYLQPVLNAYDLCAGFKTRGVLENQYPCTKAHLSNYLSGIHRDIEPIMHAFYEEYTETFAYSNTSKKNPQ